jgi:DNA repair protein RadD
VRANWHRGGRFFVHGTEAPMELRDYQQEAVEAGWNYLCSQGGNPVICLPTGGGKSWIAADLCRTAIKKYQGRVLVLAHRKELLTQNAEKIRLLCPDLDVGIYSAGLKSRDTDHACVVAGIQSVFRKAHELGARHLVIIDEVHLVPRDGEGMYRKFLDDLHRINPYLRMIGLTATPYRLDSGPICRPNALFHTVCYSASIRELIDQGYLCQLITKSTSTHANLESVHIRGGEFISGEAERAFCQIVPPACEEMIKASGDRKSILVFTSGVQHAEQVAQCITTMTGEDVGVVTGDTFPLTRARILEDFQAGRLRWCVNVDVLTTGFDAPNIDCIAVLRATMSPGLFAQIVGRGFRIHPGKNDCLILDFGGNIQRHGPIDAPNYGLAEEPRSAPGEAPKKTCPNCKTDLPLGVYKCEECDFEFPSPELEARHGIEADEAAILAEPIRFFVETVTYSRHIKRNAPVDHPPTLRVSYECQRENSTGNLSREVISEWVCIEHNGFAGRKARQWWADRSQAPFPLDVDEAVDLCNYGAVAAPKTLVATKEGRWWRVQSMQLDEVPDTWEEPVAEWEEEEVPF